MRISGRKVVSIRRLPRGGGNWQDCKPSERRPGDYCAYTTEPDARGGHFTHYAVFRPARQPDESPVAYYRRWKMVDNRYTHVWRGWYFCNPAHCSHRWRNKAERDEHLQRAYGALA